MDMPFPDCYTKNQDTIYLNTHRNYRHRTQNRLYRKNSRNYLEYPKRSFAHERETHWKKYIAITALLLFPEPRMGDGDFGHSDTTSNYKKPPLSSNPEKIC
ncbi:hypothetical protein CDAR_497501 [Caerostris darwini]|uniref:Uncharacterized protein n=1 Tax=Caerostris darwini TaxID=1538125 RepID=A0AAV4S0V2_9ARAC|nr:hypothetical protein CDAR_497501 [Caerostris darwini]